ncbi:hypothetical protein [Histidinibacterium lentulum]|uniref:Uncharacterized protein n=1 Tax=Histidinibacterium lentulum TaxID=2480588 RepID=A0A3N2QTU1_9RHOB|nr:hypothetical protein [Histidinibacterium lentulum]ROT98623.1 hypothetical protein EAT49_16945 [Histidinibacterium lentulum]
MTAAAVSASLGADPPRRVSAISPAERTLKPYGIAMLPEEAAAAARTREGGGPVQGPAAYRRDF